MKKPIFFSVILLLFSPFAAASDYSGERKKGFQILNKGESSRAPEIFSRLVEDSPQKPEAYCPLAIKNISRGRFNTVLDFLSEPQEMPLPYSQLYYLKGLVLEHLRRDDSRAAVEAAGGYDLHAVL